MTKKQQPILIVGAIVIIAVISAAAYPNFSSWRKERSARSGSIEIKSIIENIHAQSQRGLYGFVQVQFTESKGNLTVISRGMKKDKLTWYEDSVAFTYTVSSSDFQPGEHRVEIKVVDKGGNERQSGVTFLVDNCQP